MKTFFSFKLFFVFWLFPILIIHAQIGLKELPFKKQIENSSLIVEGKVISKKSFWSTDGLIYTANTIEVFKVFKGEQLSTVDVITLGGTVGLKGLMANPSLKLQMGDVGVFVLVKSGNTVSKTKGIINSKIFKPYGSLQGFYKYNLLKDLAANPFNKKQGIETSFYNEIMTYTKKPYVEIKTFGIKSKAINSLKNVSLPPTGIMFSPTMASAGTSTVLTITGSDFGATQGKVGFSNADDGGATFVNALDTQVLSWNDTQIIVEIPFNAGTGPVLVTDATTPTPGSGVSGADLTISYAEFNVVFNPGTGDQAYPIQHIGENGNGGYTWEMQTDFFNDTEHPGAKASFENSFNKWICETGINWTVSSTATTVDKIGDDTNSDGEPDLGDGTNIIRFDNGSELGINVLGICYSWFSGCGGTTVNWFVSELDIVFDSETNWYFGAGLPAISEFDFESVALHELGHGHQLSHVIDTTFDGDNSDDVMHYALSNGEQQRVLTNNNTITANNIQSRSTSTIVCSSPLMTNVSCPLSIEEEELKTAISIYPNPTKGQFFIKNESSINLEKVVIYDISGRLISKYDISITSSRKTINLVGVSKGVYFVNIYSEAAFITRKIVID